MNQFSHDSCTCGTGLYDRELAHRMTNGLQQAIAAIHLVRRHGAEHLDTAMDRLTGIAEVNGMLAPPADDGLIDLVEAIEAVSAATARSIGATGVTLMVHGEPLVTTSRGARPMLMTIAELVSNAIRHGLGPGGGSVAIDVFDDGLRTEVFVEDDGRCRSWDRPGGQGHGIVDALAADLGGTVTRNITPMGSASVAVAVPSLAAAAMAVGGRA